MIVELIGQVAMATNPEVLKWATIAYDLASELIETMIPADGPPKPMCWAPCECSAHVALDAWGKAQIELLRETNPDWYSDYDRRQQSS